LHLKVAQGDSGARQMRIPAMRGEGLPIFDFHEKIAGQYPAASRAQSSPSRVYPCEFRTPIRLALVLLSAIR
jgi:hypothetical protein